MATETEIHQSFDCTKKCTSKSCATKIFQKIAESESYEDLLSAINKICLNSRTKTDQLNRTILDIACSVGNLEILPELLDKNRNDENNNNNESNGQICDIYNKDLESGYTCLHRCIYYGRISCLIELVRILQTCNKFNVGKNLENILNHKKIMDNEGLTPLELLFYLLDNQVGSHEILLKTKLNEQVRIPDFNLLSDFSEFSLAVSHTVLGKKITSNNGNNGDISEIFTLGTGHRRLGTNTSENLKPVQIKKPNKSLKFQKFETKFDHTLCLGTDNILYGFGCNKFRQMTSNFLDLPKNNIENQSIDTLYQLTKIKPFYDVTKEKVVDFSVSRFHSIVVTRKFFNSDSFKFYAFGLNAGQLGLQKYEGILIDNAAEIYNVRQSIEKNAEGNSVSGAASSGVGASRSMSRYQDRSYPTGFVEQFKKSSNNKWQVRTSPGATVFFDSTRIYVCSMYNTFQLKGFPATKQILDVSISGGFLDKSQRSKNLPAWWEEANKENNSNNGGCFSLFTTNFQGKNNNETYLVQDCNNPLKIIILEKNFDLFYYEQTGISSMSHDFCFVACLRLNGLNRLRLSNFSCLPNCSKVLILENNGKSFYIHDKIRGLIYNCKFLGWKKRWLKSGKDGAVAKKENKRDKDQKWSAVEGIKSKLVDNKNSIMIASIKKLDYHRISKFQAINGKVAYLQFSEQNRADFFGQIWGCNLPMLEIESDGFDIPADSDNSESDISSSDEKEDSSASLSSSDESETDQELQPEIIAKLRKSFSTNSKSKSSKNSVFQSKSFTYSLEYNLHCIKKAKQAVTDRQCLFNIPSENTIRISLISPQNSSSNSNSSPKSEDRKSPTFGGFFSQNKFENVQKASQKTSKLLFSEISEKEMDLDYLEITTDIPVSARQFLIDQAFEFIHQDYSQFFEVGFPLKNDVIAGYLEIDESRQQLNKNDDLENEPELISTRNIYQDFIKLVEILTKKLPFSCFNKLLFSKLTKRFYSKDNKKVMEHQKYKLRDNPISNSDTNNHHFKINRNRISNLANLNIQCEDGVVIPVNSEILESRSEYFNMMLNSGFAEGNNSIDGENNNNTIQFSSNSTLCYAILDFIYSEKIPSEKFELSELSNLILLSDQYLLPELTAHCEVLLSKRINISNFQEITMLSYMIEKSHTTLLPVCFTFILANLPEILEKNLLSNFLDDNYDFDGILLLFDEFYRSKLGLETKDLALDDLIPENEGEKKIEQQKADQKRKLKETEEEYFSILQAAGIVENSSIKEQMAIMASYQKDNLVPEETSGSSKVEDFPKLGHKLVDNSEYLVNIPQKTEIRSSTKASQQNSTENSPKKPTKFTNKKSSNQKRKAYFKELELRQEREQAERQKTLEALSNQNSENQSSIRDWSNWRNANNNNNKSSEKSSNNNNQNDILKKSIVIDCSIVQNSNKRDKNSLSTSSNSGMFKSKSSSSKSESVIQQTLNQGLSSNSKNSKNSSANVWSSPNSYSVENNNFEPQLTSVFEQELIEIQKQCRDDLLKISKRPHTDLDKICIDYL